VNCYTCMSSNAITIPVAEPTLLDSILRAFQPLPTQAFTRSSISRAPITPSSQISPNSKFPPHFPHSVSGLHSSPNNKTLAPPHPNRGPTSKKSLTQPKRVYIEMRFFAVLLVFAFVLAVSAAPKNVPQWSAETAAEFNEQSLGLEKRTFEGLQRELDNWLNPVRKVCPRALFIWRLTWGG